MHTLFGVQAHALTSVNECPPHPAYHRNGVRGKFCNRDVMRPARDHRRARHVECGRYSALPCVPCSNPPSPFRCAAARAG